MAMGEGCCKKVQGNQSRHVEPKKMTGIALQPNGLLQLLVHGPTSGSKVHQCTHDEGLRQVPLSRLVLAKRQRADIGAGGELFFTKETKTL